MLGNSSYRVQRMVILAILKRRYVCVKQMQLVRKFVVLKETTISMKVTISWLLSTS